MERGYRLARTAARSEEISFRIAGFDGFTCGTGVPIDFKNLEQGTSLEHEVGFLRRG